MLNLKLENLGGYASKPTKIHILTLIVVLTQVSPEKVALMSKLVPFYCFRFIPFTIVDFPIFRPKTINNKINNL